MRAAWASVIQSGLRVAELNDRVCVLASRVRGTAKGGSWVCVPALRVRGTEGGGCVPAAITAGVCVLAAVTVGACLPAFDTAYTAYTVGSVDPEGVCVPAVDTAGAVGVRVLAADSAGATVEGAGSGAW